MSVRRVFWEDGVLTCDSRCTEKGAHLVFWFPDYCCRDAHEHVYACIVLTEPEDSGTKTCTHQYVQKSEGRLGFHVKIQPVPTFPEIVVYFTGRVTVYPELQIMAT